MLSHSMLSSARRILVVALFAALQLVVQPLASKAWCAVASVVGGDCCCLEQVAEHDSCCAGKSSQPESQRAALSKHACACSAAADQEPAPEPESLGFQVPTPTWLPAWEGPTVEHRVVARLESPTRATVPRVGLSLRSWLQVFRI